MITISLEPAGRRRSAAYTVLAGLAFAAAGLISSPTLAQAPQQSWEIGCAYKSLPTGNGEAIRTLNCERQKTCQEMANAKGAMMMEKGCFFVEPIGRAPAAQPGRLRPTQQQ